MKKESGRPLPTTSANDTNGLYIILPKYRTSGHFSIAARWPSRDSQGPLGCCTFSQPPRYVNPKLAELEKEIEREYLIRDGGAKLLQASKSSKQSMEASKGLFVSDAKIIGCMRELQHQKSISGVHPPTVR